MQISQKGGRSVYPRGALAIVTAATLAASAGAWGQVRPMRPPVLEAAAEGSGYRDAETRIHLDRVDMLRVNRHGVVIGPGPNFGGATDSCNVLSSWTDASFTGGSYIVEAGFGQTEMTAASYTIAASEFPIKINLVELLLGTQNATVQTTTQWSLIFYSGTPTAGTVVDTFSSDDIVLPHARVGPGTAGVNIQFSIDPGDPEQLYIPDNGSHTFTVAFRIDHHNQQTQDPCSVAPPTCCNAFPLADCCTGGSCPSGCTASSLTGNWLGGINCGAGPFNCPPTTFGNTAPIIWGTFQSMGSSCRPHGDWVMHVNWSGVSCTPGVGACCKTDGTCQSMLATDCSTISGTYQGDGSQCAQVTCPQPTAACCFSNGTCLNRTAASCASLSGTWLGVGTTCSGSACPTGACCLANGTCTGPVSQTACTSAGGVFQGVGILCANVNCPQPTGACCTNGGAGCDILTQSDCNLIGGVWHGAGSTCAASCVPPSGACCTSGGGCDLLTQADCNTIGGTWHGAGSSCATACAPVCYANCDASTSAPILNVADFTCFLQKYAGNDPYANCDASTSAPTLNVADFTCFLQKYAQGCT